MENARLVALVDRTLAGDVASWPELWQGLRPVIEAVTACPQWASRLRRSSDERHDIVIRVMGKLAAGDFAALRRFRDPEAGQPAESFLPWIATVAANAAISHVRAHPEYRGRRAGGIHWMELDPLSDEADEIAGEEYDPIPDIDAHRLAERLGPLLRPAQRAALGLWLEDHEHDEIARKLQLADKKAAKRQVRSAVTLMRAHLAEDESTG